MQILYRATLALFSGIVALGLGGCASSSITPMSRNTAMISTTAAPICRTTGAASVAQQMAAVATIRQGYERYMIGGFGTANNTRVSSLGPTSAYTTGTVTSFGNTAYGSASTTYGGQMLVVSGSNDAQMQVVMFNRGDPGYQNAIDARQTLGPDWQKKVANGINTCL